MWLKALMSLFKTSNDAYGLNYPASILPCRRYLKFDFNILCNLPNVVIARRSNYDSYESTFDRNGLLLIDALRRQSNKEIFNNSMNLLGGRFKKRHVRFLQKGIAQDCYIIGSSPIPLKQLLPFISTTNIKINILFKLNKIYNAEFPYQVPETPAKSKKEFDRIKIPIHLAVEVNGEPAHYAKFNGRSVIKHSPTNANYWHVEFDLLPVAESPEHQLTEDDKSKAWGKAIVNTAFQQILRKHGKRNCGRPSNIWPWHYSRYKIY